jgi:hypothetical protein
MLPFIAEWCTWRAARFTGRDVMQAYKYVMAAREAAIIACQPFDYVLSPVSPILPYEAERAAPEDDPHDALADRRAVIQRPRRAQAGAPGRAATADPARLARASLTSRTCARRCGPWFSRSSSA